MCNTGIMDKYDCPNQKILSFKKSNHLRTVSKVQTEKVLKGGLT